MREAIVVRRDGAVLTGFCSACRLGVSGGEEYYTVAEFAFPRKHVAQPHELRPHGVQDGETYWVNAPHVYSSRQMAEKARARLSCSQQADTAVVIVE